MNKYKKLTEILRKEKHVKKRTTIPVIITTDDFIKILFAQTSKTQYQR